MSYILDALRRADAERERDPARGIHAQPAAVLPRERQLRSTSLALAGVAVVAAVAGAYLLATPTRERPDAPAVHVQAAAQEPMPATPPAPPAMVTVAAVVLPPPPTPAPAVERPSPRPALATGERGTVKAPVMVAKMSTVPPQPGVTSAPRTAPAEVPAASPTAPAAAPAAAPSAAPAATPSSAPSNAATTGPATAPSSATPAGSTPPARVVAVGELPADIQRELPKLVIAGGVHSENPAQRMLIVGGQVRSEGAELAPGLVLEQIRAGSAVLRFRGWRYSVGY